jgi:hypothetical protein
MIDLTYYWNLATSAEEENQNLMSEAKMLLNSGIPSDQEKALAMRPSLEEARKKVEVTSATYRAVRDNTFCLNDLSDVTRDKIINRAIFDKLDPQKRWDFMKQGGKVKD